MLKNFDEIQKAIAYENRISLYLTTIITRKHPIFVKIYMVYQGCWSNMSLFCTYPTGLRPWVLLEVSISAFMAS